MRGDAQNMSITNDVLDKFFDGFNSGASIGMITFTGGEISLNVDAIQYSLNAVKQRNITVDSFYMVTNGKSYPRLKKLIKTSFDWYLYVESPEMSGIALSLDPFHETIKNWYDVKKALSGVSYFRPDDKDMTKFNTIVLLNEGKAKTLTLYEKRDLCIYAPEIFETVTGDKISVEEGMIYLACNGNILPSCDMSYEHADSFAAANVNGNYWVAAYEGNYTAEALSLKS